MSATYVVVSSAYTAQWSIQSGRSFMKSNGPQDGPSVIFGYIRPVWVAELIVRHFICTLLACNRLHAQGWRNRGG